MDHGFLYPTFISNNSGYDGRRNPCIIKLYVVADIVDCFCLTFIDLKGMMNVSQR